MRSPEIPIEKWHGAGNDFIVVNANEVSVDQQAFAIRECNRDQGIGADGVLFLSLDADQTPVRVEMALVQPDGSTAAMCGNGARIAAQWAVDRTGEHEIIIVTPAGDRPAVINENTVTVDMGAFSFDPLDVNLDRTTPLIGEPMNGLTITAVNTGVPHAVAFVPDIEAVDLEIVAPPIRNNPVFLEGANVTVAASETAGYHQRTFERGVEGETVACGTGAVAIAAVAYRQGNVLAETPITIWPPGGTLQVTIHADGTASLTGPVEQEFTKTLEGA